MSSNAIPAELMLRKEMELYEDDDWGDPELEDSAYNPANDEFKRTVVTLQRRIHHLSAVLPPRYALTARLSLAPFTYVEIAKKVRFTPTTVSRLLKDDKVQELRRALIQLRNLLSGVSALEREQMLWRIALNNEEFNPRTSIAAISEMNKMKIDHAAAQEKSKQNTILASQPQVVIQLADARLIPTALDEQK